MNFTNLVSILESKNNLSDELFKKYLKYLNINIGENEIEDLLKLIKKLLKEDQNSNIFDGYYIGYKIPQISKQFDLLKITKTSVINIELKSGANNEKIKEQLIKNKHYLDSIRKEKVYNITYQSKDDKIYILNKEKELNELEVKELIKILVQKSSSRIDLNTLFDPSEFLVSPFNSPEKFIEGKYFLTDQQNEFKKNIIEIIKNKKTSVCAVSGKAGTGKTLLVYDIAKEMICEKKKVLIVHCGKLNDGHEKLVHNHEMDIISIKSFTEKQFSENYNLIIFDEAQRIRADSFYVILKNKEKSNYLFSYDETQTLSHKDGKYDDKTVAELYSNTKNHFKLSDNIRTNKEVASFIRRFINKNESKSDRQYKNITIQNFEKMDNVESYLINLKDNGWTYISYTPKGRGKKGVYEEYNINSEYSQNAHDVIGQEFDNVVVIVGEKFLYKETGELTYDGSKDTSVYYIPHKMLFQAITRVRKRLKIIIVNNPDILENCINILN